MVVNIQLVSGAELFKRLTSFTPLEEPGFVPNTVSWSENLSSLFAYTLSVYVEIQHINGSFFYEKRLYFKADTQDLTCLKKYPSIFSFYMCFKTNCSCLYVLYAIKERLIFTCKVNFASPEWFSSPVDKSLLTFKLHVTGFGTSL